MKMIIEVLMFCAFQKEIALRGHREVDSKNSCNFLELLDLVSNHDSVLKTKLHDGAKNADYTSHAIQNKLLHILATSVRHIICQCVKGAGFYSIIIDESMDSSLFICCAIHG